MIVASVTNVIRYPQPSVVELRTYKTVVDQITGKEHIEFEHHYYNYTFRGVLESLSNKGSTIDKQV